MYLGEQVCLTNDAFDMLPIVIDVKVCIHIQKARERYRLKD